MKTDGSIQELQPELSDYLHRHKPLWNWVAILYTVLSYMGGIALLLVTHGWLNALGVLVLTHSLVTSAYLAHEFMHGTIFRERRWNSLFGNLMLWFNGSSYFRLRDLARRHIDHHKDRVDFSAFDLPDYLHRLPGVVRSLLMGLEWLYIPSLSFLLQWRAIAVPFLAHSKLADERPRIALNLIARTALFSLLGIVSLKALLLYFVAYISMINVLRFVDAFQHTYDVFPIGTPLPERDRAYEQANTFSNIISVRHRWLNLLLLNFGYHNAHHVLMKCPWHSLHELDQALFSGQEIHYVTLPRLIYNYHRFRTSRIFSGQGQAVDPQGNLKLDRFYGAVGVSFLVPVS